MILSWTRSWAASNDARLRGLVSRETVEPWANKVAINDRRL